MFALNPALAVLSRLQAFLPEMKAANEALAAALETAEDPSVFHVDHVSDEEAEHIEMVCAVP